MPKVAEQERSDFYVFFTMISARLNYKKRY